MVAGDKMILSIEEMKDIEIEYRQLRKNGVEVSLQEMIEYYEKYSNTKFLD